MAQQQQPQTDKKSQGQLQKGTEATKTGGKKNFSDRDNEDQENLDAGSDSDSDIEADEDMDSGGTQGANRGAKDQMQRQPGSVGSKAAQNNQNKQGKNNTRSRQ